MLTFLNSISLKFFLQFLVRYESTVEEDIRAGYFEAPSFQASVDTLPSVAIFILLHLPLVEPCGVLIFAVAA